ncbi:MAG: LamG-like jellyroll fold domain-containing protein [Bacteroidota bacterium]
MKRIFLYVLLGVWAQIPWVHGQLTLQDSLSAYYPFDGNTLDASGNGNDGTPFGAVFTTDRFGNPGSAIFLDGTDDFIQLNGANKFYPQLPVTISAWVLIQDYGNVSNPVFDNDYEINNYNGVIMNLNTGVVSISYGDGGIVGPGSRRTKTGTTVLSLNTWYHVVGVIRGAQDMTIYINGEDDCGSYSGFGGNLYYDFLPGVVGQINGTVGNPANFFHGKIDELYFHRRALSASEVQTLAGQPDTLVICLGDTTQLDAGNGNSFSWSPGAGLSCTNCPEPLAFTTASTAYQALVLRPGGCTDTVFWQVEVDSVCNSCIGLGLQADFLPSQDFMELTAIDQSQGTIDSILWEWGDGDSLLSLPGVGGFHVYALPDTYEVCQTVFGTDSLGNICTDQLCQSTVAELPCDSLFLQPMIDVSGSFLEVEVLNQSTGTYQEASWDFGDGFIQLDSGVPILHTYATPDTYQICLSLTGIIPGGDTCVETICETFVATQPMVCADLELNAAFTAITSQYTTQFEDFSTGMIDSLQWFPGDGSVYQVQAGASLNHTYAVYDTFEACLVVYGSLPDESICTDTACVPVIPDLTTACDTTPISADFSHSLNGLQLVVQDQSFGSSIDEIHWNLDGVNWVSGQMGGTASYTFPGSGIYPVCLEAITWYGDTLACRDTVCEDIEIRVTSVEDARLAKHIELVPNPFSEQLTIRLKRELISGPVQVEVVNLHGQLVLHQACTEAEVQLSTTTWPAGMYWVRVQGESWSYSEKVLKWE